MLRLSSGEACSRAELLVGLESLGPRTLRRHSRSSSRGCTAPVCFHRQQLQSHLHAIEHAHAERRLKTEEGAASRSAGPSTSQGVETTFAVPPFPRDPLHTTGIVLAATR